MSNLQKRGGMFLGYGNEISKKSYFKIVKTICETHFDQWAKSWDDIVNLLNDKIRGWVQYYDKHRPRILKGVFRRFHSRLAKWIQSHFKKFKRSKERAYDHLEYIRRHYPNLFYHWEIGYAI